MKLPYPPCLLRLLRSSMLVWFMTRATYALVLIFGVLFFRFLSLEEGIQSALHPPGLLRLLLVGLTAVLVHLDRRRTHEHLLQANFGVPAVWFSATSLVAAGLADLTVQALLRVS